MLILHIEVAGSEEDFQLGALPFPPACVEQRQPVPRSRADFRQDPQTLLLGHGPQGALQLPEDPVCPDRHDAKQEWVVQCRP